MTLSQLVTEKTGTYVLYWYEGNYLFSKVCTPEIVDDCTIRLVGENVPEMSHKSLFCLAFEEDGAEDIFIINKGLVENKDDGVYLNGTDFEVTLNDKRFFYRYEISAKIVVMGTKTNVLAQINNISYNGVNVTMHGDFEIGENVMMYDPDERTPIYIPGTIVYSGDGNDYGIIINGEYSHINKIVIPKISNS